MKRKRRVYLPEETRIEALRDYFTGHATQEAVAARYGIVGSTLSKWIELNGLRGKSIEEIGKRFASDEPWVWGLGMRRQTYIKQRDAEKSEADNNGKVPSPSKLERENRELRDEIERLRSVICDMALEQRQTRGGK